MSNAELDPKQQELIARLEPLGWRPDEPSDECREALTPPGRIEHHEGLDQVGLMWRWARMKVMAKLTYGGLRSLGDQEHLDIVWIAYMHVASWVAENFDNTELAGPDHAQNFPRVLRWDMDRCRPNILECDRVLKLHGVQGLSRDHELGFTAGLFNCAMDVMPVRQHMSALHNAFDQHYVHDHGQTRSDARKLTAKDLGPNDSLALEWLDVLGGVGKLGYFTNGKFLLSSREMRKKLRSLLGYDGDSSLLRHVGVVPIGEDCDPQDLRSSSDDALLLYEILGIEDDQDATELDLDLEETIRKAASESDAPADMAARLILAIGGNRSEAARICGVSEVAVRRAEKKLKDGQA